MRIAIIGSGISGLVSAYHLNKIHDITLYEANGYIGGHTNTFRVQKGGNEYSIDTGFIVFNDRTYPNFRALLNELKVKSDPTSMSFSISCDRTGLEYNSNSLNGLFAQRSNLLKPRFYKLLAEILRFNRNALQLLESNSVRSQTVSEFLQKYSYSKDFCDRYLLPMGAAIWSCPPSTFQQFPIEFILQFYRNHGLLSLRDRPVWRVIRGGSSRYVDALTNSFRNRIFLNSPVRQVHRYGSHVELFFNHKEPEVFDEVIFACHSDQALKLLTQPTKTEQDVLGSFPYSTNIAILHTDESVLPKQRRAWASWNYHVQQNEIQNVTVTYNMNILQHLRSNSTFCVTLNSSNGIDPEKIIHRIMYEHPIFTIDRKRAQKKHYELIRKNRTSYCGAYWGNGFHEDGVNSALAVINAFNNSFSETNCFEKREQLVGKVVHT